MFERVMHPNFTSIRCVMAAGVLGLCAVMSVAAANPVGDALDRPALMSRQAAQSVMLGAALAGARIVAVGERGIVLLSDDSGKTWRQVPVPVSVTLTAVHFIDARHGLAVGHGGTVLATLDGGETWTRRLDGKRIAQLALEAAKASGDAAALQEAQRLNADGPDKPLLDVRMLDAQRAIVVGAYGLMFATADGGTTWKPWMARLQNPQGLHLYSLRTLGSTLLVAGEQGLVLRSEDAGKSFSRLTLPYKGSFFTCELSMANEILVAGLRGNAWRSEDGGKNWLQVNALAPVSFTGSALAADGSPLLVNQAGMLLGLHDGALKPLVSSPLPALNAILPLAGGSLLALTTQGVMLVPAVGAAK